MKYNHRKWLQFGMIVVIIIISFSFLFVYANTSDQTSKENIGLSSVETWKHIEYTDEQTEKKEVSNEKKTETEKTNDDSKTANEEDITSTEEKKPEKEASVSKKTPSQQETVNQEDTKSYAIISVDMRNILNHKGEVKPEYQGFIPEDGILIASTKVEIEEGDTAYSLLIKVCKTNGIRVDASNGYVKYINNIGEFDAGTSSGWLYKVNGGMPNIGSSSYQVKENDVIEWRYTVKVGDI